MVKIAKLAVIGVFAAVLALFGGTLSASADQHVSQISGNPSCEGGLKIEPVNSGTYGPITITVHGSSFDFSANGVLVTSVIVKGGPNANLYTYPAPGVSSDTGLTAPINASNGRPYGLSHLCFFFDDKKTPDPDPKK